MSEENQQITQLLDRVSAGDREATDDLLAEVYPTLKTLARQQLSKGARHHTLNTMAVVNEAFMKLIGQDGAAWNSRAHFFGCAAKAMRHIIVDYARTRTAQKRGGGAVHVELSNESGQMTASPEDIVALHQALEQLEAVDPRIVQVVEMRFFAGLSVEETAAALDVSPITVKRDWRKARAIVHASLG